MPGQRQAWDAHHKRICSAYSRYTASSGYQQLLPYQKADAVLLSHLVAEHRSQLWREELPDDPSSPIAIFMSLLKTSESRVPPICLSSSVPPPSAEHVGDLYSRFGNNNFVVHSHLTPIGHGIFPLASRLFNHSCTPNAAVKFIITANQPVRMEVVALREIAMNEEVRETHKTGCNRLKS